MDRDFTIQYQGIATPPPGPQPGPDKAAQWIQPWSLPVRLRIDPRLLAALAVSGPPVASILPTSLLPGQRYESPWHQPWSEPVRLKRISAALQAPPSNLTLAEFQEIILADKWFAILSEPVRLKPGLKFYLQPLAVMDWKFSPTTLNVLEDHRWLDEPVRQKSGLPFGLQQSYIGPPMAVPLPATIIIRATDSQDIFNSAINVYTPSTATASLTQVVVSIVEIGPDGSPVSIREGP